MILVMLVLVLVSLMMAKVTTAIMLEGCEGDGDHGSDDEDKVATVTALTMMMVKWCGDEDDVNGDCGSDACDSRSDHGVIVFIITSIILTSAAAAAATTTYCRRRQP